MQILTKLQIYGFKKKSVMLIYFLKFLGLRRKRKFFSDILYAFQVSKYQRGKKVQMESKFLNYIIFLFCSMTNNISGSHSNRIYELESYKNPFGDYQESDKIKQNNFLNEQEENNPPMIQQENPFKDAEINKLFKANISDQKQLLAMLKLSHKYDPSYFENHKLISMISKAQQKYSGKQNMRESINQLKNNDEGIKKISFQGIEGKLLEHSKEDIIRETQSLIGEKQKLTNLQNQNSKLKKEIEAMMLNLSQEKIRNHKFESQVQSLKAYNSQLEEQVLQYEDAVQDFTQDKYQKGQSGQVTAQKALISEKMSATAFEELKLKCQMTEQIYEEQIEDLATEITKYRKQLQQMEQKNLIEMNKLSQEYEESLLEKNYLLDDIIALEKSILMIKEQNYQLTLKTQSLEKGLYSKCQKLQSEVSKLKKYNCELREEFLQYEDIIQDSQVLEKQNLHISKMLMEKNMMNASLCQSQILNQVNLQTLEQQIETLFNEFEIYRKSFEQCRKRSIQKTTRLQQYELKINSLNQQVLKTKQLTTMYQNKVKQLEECLIELKTQEKQSNQYLLEEKMKNKELQFQIDKIKAFNCELFDKNIQYEDKIDQLGKENEEILLFCEEAFEDHEELLNARLLSQNKRLIQINQVNQQNKTLQSIIQDYVFQIEELKKKEDITKTAFKTIQVNFLKNHLLKETQNSKFQCEMRQLNAYLSQIQEEMLQYEDFIQQLYQYSQQKEITNKLALKTLEKSRGMLMDALIQSSLQAQIYEDINEQLNNEVQNLQNYEQQRLLKQKEFEKVQMQNLEIKRENMALIQTRSFLEMQNSKMKRDLERINENSQIKEEELQKIELQQIYLQNRIPNGHEIESFYYQEEPLQIYRENPESISSTSQLYKPLLDENSLLFEEKLGQIQLQHSTQNPSLQETYKKIQILESQSEKLEEQENNIQEVDEKLQNMRQYIDRLVSSYQQKQTQNNHLKCQVLMLNKLIKQQEFYMNIEHQYFEQDLQKVAKNNSQKISELKKNIHISQVDFEKSNVIKLEKIQKLQQQIRVFKLNNEQLTQNLIMEEANHLNLSKQRNDMHKKETTQLKEQLEILSSKIKYLQSQVEQKNSVSEKLNELVKKNSNNYLFITIEIKDLIEFLLEMLNIPIDEKSSEETQQMGILQIAQSILKKPNSQIKYEELYQSLKLIKNWLFVFFYQNQNKQERSCEDCKREQPKQIPELRNKINEKEEKIKKLSEKNNLIKEEKQLLNKKIEKYQKQVHGLKKDNQSCKKSLQKTSDSLKKQKQKQQELAIKNKKITKEMEEWKEKSLSYLSFYYKKNLKDQKEESSIVDELSKLVLKLQKRIRKAGEMIPQTINHQELEFSTQDIQEEMNQIVDSFDNLHNLIKKFSTKSNKSSEV